MIDTGVGTGTLIRKWPLRASPSSVRIRPTAPERLVAAQAVMQKASNHERPTDGALDQHYTNKCVTRDCVEMRDLPHTESSHPDFDFTGREDADFALQRVGGNAGQVHYNLKLKDSSHYFVRANATGVEATMLALQPEFAEIASNTAGNPSLAKTEIVALYRERTEGITPFWKIPRTGSGSSN